MALGIKFFQEAYHLLAEVLIKEESDIVLKVLDWKHGYFELTAGAPSPGKVEIDTTVTHLLLEHARLRDEAGRES